MIVGQTLVVRKHVFDVLGGGGFDGENVNEKETPLWLRQVTSTSFLARIFRTMSGQLCFAAMKRGVRFFLSRMLILTLGHSMRRVAASGNWCRRALWSGDLPLLSLILTSTRSSLRRALIPLRLFLIQAQCSGVSPLSSG